MEDGGWVENEEDGWRMEEWVEDGGWVEDEEVEKGRRRNGGGGKWLKRGWRRRR